MGEPKAITRNELYYMISTYLDAVEKDINGAAECLANFEKANPNSPKLKNLQFDLRYSRHVLLGISRKICLHCNALIDLSALHTQMQSMFDKMNMHSGRPCFKYGRVRMRNITIARNISWVIASLEQEEE